MQFIFIGPQSHIECFPKISLCFAGGLNPLAKIFEDHLFENGVMALDKLGQEVLNVSGTKFY